MVPKGELRGWTKGIYVLLFISFSEVTLGRGYRGGGGGGGINSTNLSCLTSVLAGGTSDSRNSS